MRRLAMIAAACLVMVALPAQANEAKASALFDRVASQEARLRVFLQNMPKGGDLHNHLSGSPYAEQYIEWAAEKELCVSRSGLTFAAPPCDTEDLQPAKDLGRRDAALYDALIEAMSTRAWSRGVGADERTGHEDFFSTFGQFAPVSSITSGAMVAAVRQSAAANGVSYVETMENPATIDEAIRIVMARPWRPDDFDGALAALAPALPGLVDKGIAEIDAWEADAARRIGCDADPDAAACRVTLRYQAYGLRGLPPPVVFAQFAYGFALADQDDRYVGVNIVMPEDGPVSMADFGLHMQMLRYFAARHPTVKLSLHAGELELGLVPPAGLTHHIRDSIEIAGAHRIGHGIDIAYETDAPDLLARMARDRIAVEINLTSNDTILGVSGARHPLALYRAAGVPVVISTDDEGVSRSDMTNEYLRATTEQGLRYADLKQIARASLEYAFLPGESFWREGAIGVRRATCRGVPADAVPAGACATWLAAHEKAREQWRLEAAFAAFEQRIVALKF